jgi:hypothetical protein
LDWHWTDNKDTIVNFGTLDMVSNETYYFYVKAKNRAGLWSNVSASNGIIVYKQTASEVKMMPSNTTVKLADKVSTGSLGSCFYVQETDRSSGIRVESSNGPESGTLVTISGKIQSVNGEAAIVNPTVTSTGNADVKPLGLNNKAIGGSQIGLQQATWAYTQDAWSSANGLNNIGLLVTTTGTVTYIDPAGLFAYIDDGSGITDGNTLGSGGDTVPGIRVILGSAGDIRAIASEVGTNLIATGIATTRTTSSKLVPNVRVRIQDDLRGVSGAMISGNVLGPSVIVNNVVQSPHPYQNNYYYSWSITGPTGTPSMRLHFTQVEVSGNDFVYYSAPGGQLHTISNVNQTNFWSDWIPGNKINLYLYTDGSGTYYGLKTDKYEAEGGPLAGVTLTLMPGNITAITNAMGSYVFFGVPDGTYTITPSKSGVTFNPSNTLVTIEAGQCVKGVDFNAN